MAIALPYPARLPIADGGLLISRQGMRTARHYWHNGIDLAAPAGTPVFAIAPGIVKEVCVAGSYRCSGYGNAILVKHAENLFSWYAHLNSILVEAGDSVDGSVQIGTVGTTFGTPTDPMRRLTVAHLHLELVTHWPLNSRDIGERYDVLGVLASSGIVLEGLRLALSEPADYVEPALAEADDKMLFEVADPSTYRSAWPIYGLLIGASLLFGSMLYFGAKGSRE